MDVSYLILWCALTCVGFLPDEPAYFDVQTITHEDNLAFPVFSLDVHPDIALKINRHLQLSELELLDGHQEESLFEKVAVNDGSIYGGKVGITPSVLTNTPRLLCVYFDEGSCGMTCTYWNRYYNFNAGNGDLIQVEDLMTSEDYREFRKVAVERRSAQFQSQIDTLNQDLEHLDYVIDGFPDDDLREWYIDGDSLFFDGFNCLAKNDMGYGIDMITGFSFQELGPYLNDYGKAVLGLSTVPVKKFRSGSLPQLMSGYVNGRYSVFLLMRRLWENRVEGIYAYKKYGVGIELEGTLEGNNLSLVEKEDFDDNGYIEGIFTGNQITGVWKDKEKKQQYSFVVQNM